MLVRQLCACTVVAVLLSDLFLNKSMANKILFLDQCTIHQAFRHLFDECNSFYSWEKEDEGQYLKGWQKNIEENVNDNDTATEKQKNAWEYNTAWELKGTPYWAGFSTYWGGGMMILYTEYEISIDE